MTTQSTFAANVRRLRERRDLTQQQLAEAIGCSQPYVVLIEAGKRWPAARRIDRIAEILNVKSSTLFFRKK